MDRRSAAERIQGLTQRRHNDCPGPHLLCSFHSPCDRISAGEAGKPWSSQKREIVCKSCMGKRYSWIIAKFVYRFLDGFHQARSRLNAGRVRQARLSERLVERWSSGDSEIRNKVIEGLEKIGDTQNISKLQSRFWRERTSAFLGSLVLFLLGVGSVPHRSLERDVNAATRKSSSRSRVLLSYLY